MRKVITGLQLVCGQAAQFGLATYEGWHQVGSVAKVLQDNQIIKGLKVEVQQVIQVCMYAQDLAFQKPIFQLANCRGGWWMRPNPEWGLEQQKGKSGDGKDVENKKEQDKGTADQSHTADNAWAGWEERQAYRKKKEGQSDDKYKDTPWRQRGWHGK